jgi:pyruvate carboxylase subunit B
MLEVANAGADILDVAMEPLSWGMVHPDVITIHAMLKDAGFEVPEINMNAYMHARSLTQEFMDDFLVYFIDPKNKHTSSLLIGCGLPGGMMGSLMADLKGVHNAINMFLRKDGKKELNEDELLVQLFEEVAYVWPKVGNPPLVTPFSQYVKNIALMNILQMAQGKERYSQMDKNTWDMILGKTGKLPGKLAPEIIELAKKNNYEFFTDTPQSYYPNELDKYRKEMDENGWDYGQDDEELFELAMHDRQYRDFKSGVAKTKFEEELAQAKQKSNIQVITKILKSPELEKEELITRAEAKYPGAKQIVAPVAGILIWELNVNEVSTPKPLGTRFVENETVCFITAYYGNEEVKSLYNGQLCEVIVNHGQKVNKGDIIAFVN